jgi:hypothetical protein
LRRSWSWRRWPAGFVQLVMHAQERVKALEAERRRLRAGKLDQERQRRVDDLVRVERKTAGASCTFAQRRRQSRRRAGTPPRCMARSKEPSWSRSHNTGSSPRMCSRPS